MFGRDQWRIGAVARWAGQAGNRDAVKTLQGYCLRRDRHDRRHAMRGTDAVVEASVALIVTRRRASMTIPAMGGAMIMGGKPVCFAPMRVTGGAELCRQQPGIRIEPEAQHGDQHDCDVPAPANPRLLHVL